MAMAAPRAVKDSDTALWLHNKLGSSEELWVSSSIGGIIKTDTIDNIYRCFPVLTTTVKMKLLLGILHLPRRSLDEMKHMIEGLVELALEDVDQWVRLVAKVVKTYPMRGKLNLDLSSNPIAANVIQQLREKVNDSDVFATLPLECQYVNRNALQSLVGNQPPPVRHFALKRKPKSAALRVDLLQRSSDASNQVKKDGSGFNKTVPVKHRDMTRKLSDASPMRGIPKTPSGGHRSEGFRSQSTPSSHLTPGAVNRTASRFSSRSERGTKLLDISEQPVGIREQKRRKKQQQEEEPQQPAAEDKVDEMPEYAAGLPQTVAQPVLPDEEPTEPTTDKDENQVEDEEEQDQDMEEEDYSPAGSPSKSYSAIQEPEPTVSKSPSQENVIPRKAAVAEKRPSVEELPVYAMPATPSPYFKPVSAPSIINASPARSKPVISGPSTPMSRTSSSSTSSSSPSPARKTMQPPSTASSITNVGVRKVVVSSNPSPVQAVTQLQTKVPQPPHFYTAPIQTQPGPVVQSPSIQQQSAFLQRHPAGIYRPQVAVGVRPGMPYIVSPSIVQLRQIQPQNVRFSTAAAVVRDQTNAGVTAVNSQVIQHQLQLQQQVARQAAQVQAQQQQKKTLTLTREQMFQAQEMFKTANRLSRQEKAIILGFMAGSRENPTPDKGDVVQITLSEHEQSVQNPSGGGPIPVIVETFFEMNYRTGTTSKKQRLKQLVPQYKT